MSSYSYYSPSKNSATEERIVSLLKEAVDDPTSFVLDRLGAALDLASVARRFNDDVELDAHKMALEMLDTALAQSQSLQVQYSTFAKNRTVRRAHRVTVDAAALAIAQGNPELAVQLLDQGRGILLRQLGQFRTALDDIAHDAPELVERFKSLSNQIGGLLASANDTLLETDDNKLPQDVSSR